MRKQFFIRLLLALFPLAAFAQETKVKLTDNVTISFPEKPTFKDIQGKTSVYALALADSSAKFNAVAANLEKANGLTADVLDAAQQDPNFWIQAETAFVAQLGAGAKVIAKDIKTIGEKQVLELVIHTERNGKKIELSVYIFVDGVYSINIIYTKRSDAASTEAKKAFFNSLSISK